MKKVQGVHLLVLLLLTPAEVLLGKETRAKNERKSFTLPEDKIPRSALIGIKPEDMEKTEQTDTGDARKSEVNLLDQLPAFQEEQHLTDTALDYSSKLSPLDQRLVKQFDEAAAGKNDNSSPRPGIASRIGGDGERNNVNRNSRNFVVQVTKGEMGRTEGFNPVQDLKQDISTLRNGGLEKDFYRQISQIEGDQPQSSDAGKISDMYNNNPMPEYSYKESNYGQVSDYHSDNGGYDKYYKDNPFEMPKYPLETQKSEYEFENGDKDLFQTFSSDRGNQHTSSDNSDLYSAIGKKVVLDLLKHQNSSQVQSEDDLKQEFLKKIMGGNSDQKDKEGGNLLINKMTTTSSPNLLISRFPTLPSRGNALTSGKMSSQEALRLGAQKGAQALNLPKGINLDIQGHVFEDEPHGPVQIVKEEQAPTVRQPTSPAPEIQNDFKNFAMQSDRASVSNQLQPKDDSKKENFVTLKISGAGKPVSFKAGTSDDGSLVLKIPGNVTLVDPTSNKDIRGDTTLNQKEDENLNTKMATDAEQINRYLWESQKIPSQEFTKKGNMIDRNESGPRKEMIGWQILGKTNDKSNQEETEQNVANNLLEGNRKVVSSLRPTPGRSLNGLYILPTAIHDLSELAPTKYNELSRVSFTGVGKSPPSELFSPGLRQRQDVENNKLTSLKSFLRPTNFVEDSAVGRAGVGVGPTHNFANTPTSGMLEQEKQQTSWSPCSVTCGQGFQARARLCEGPKCKGYRTESKVCLMQPCHDQLGRAGLRLHNKFRAWHRSPPLKWSSQLAAKAQTIAKEMADNQLHLQDLDTDHSGINVAELWHDYDIAAEKATAQWYSEVKSYNFEDPAISDSNKHFTQLIWRGSKKIGIGEAKSADGRRTYVVALYDPPGNIRNKERSNVHLPKSQN